MKRFVALIVALIVVLGMATVSFAEEPFHDISYEKALAKAGAEEKIVMIDFFTTWCGPCKKLDKTTWKDEKVQAWLESKTVALKIDAEKERDLAKQFKVRAYPTMVFIKPDGSLIASMIGYKDPAAFLSIAGDRIQGITKLTETEAKFKKNPEDLTSRKAYADALMAAEKFPEALQQYTWLWNNGLSVSKSYVGVRGSFLLSKISALAKRYPPAGEQLKAWFEAVEARFKNGTASVQDASDLTSLARYGKVPKAYLLKIYDEYRALPNAKSKVTARLRSRLRSAFFEDRRYKEYLETYKGSALDDVTSEIRTMMEISKKVPLDTKSTDREELQRELDARSLAMSLRRGLEVYEAFLGADQPADATSIAHLLIEIAPEQSTIAALKKAAQRAGKPDATKGLSLPEKAGG
jgi:thioredoxin-related protein